MVPFFVADRPMSLRILKGLPLMTYSKVQIGIMAHANTSKSFQEQFRQYPCSDLDHCEAACGPCEYHDESVDDCPYRQHILKNTIKMCDSGIFTREGATLSYPELFQAYESMGVEYGIMIDIFRDPVGTIESAKQGKAIYEQGNYTFKFVAVAQGQTVEEYIDCYRTLKEDLKFEYIAIGGLLRRQQNTVRFARVENEEERMFCILKTLRELYPNDWLFALGSFNSSRLEKFVELNVWADHKGWIFNYKKRNEHLNRDIDSFFKTYLNSISSKAKAVTSLKEVFAKRNELAQKKKKLSESIILERNSLRKELQSIHQNLTLAFPDLARRFDKVATKSILNISEKKLVIDAIEKLKLSSKKRKLVLEKLNKNFELNEALKTIEIDLDALNNQLIKNFKTLLARVKLPVQAQKAIEAIILIIQKDEQSHRVEQVHDHVARTILKRLEQFEDI